MDVAWSGPWKRPACNDASFMPKLEQERPSGSKPRRSSKNKIAPLVLGGGAKSEPLSPQIVPRNVEGWDADTSPIALSLGKGDSFPSRLDSGRRSESPTTFRLSSESPETLPFRDDDAKLDGDAKLTPIQANGTRGDLSPGALSWRKLAGLDVADSKAGPHLLVGNDRLSSDDAAKTAAAAWCRLAGLEDQSAKAGSPPSPQQQDAVRATL